MLLSQGVFHDFKVANGVSQKTYAALSVKSFIEQMSGKPNVLEIP
jgi:hypothetical protein